MPLIFDLPLDQAVPGEFLSASLAVELTEINLALLLPRLPYKPQVLDGEYYISRHKNKVLFLRFCQTYQFGFY